jgi:hypothetical protein
MSGLLIESGNGDFMKVDIVIVVLLVCCVGMSSASARTRQESFASGKIANLPVLSEGVERGDSVQAANDAIGGGDQNVVAVKFELRRAPQVLISNSTYDQIMGESESAATEPNFAPTLTLQHRSFAYFTQPDLWYVLPLILLLLLMQIRALPVTRTRSRAMAPRGINDPMYRDTRTALLMEALE